MVNHQYKKAGVIVMGISPDSPIQQDLFDLNAEQIQKMRRLDEVEYKHTLEGADNMNNPQSTFRLRICFLLSWSRNHTSKLRLQ